MAKTKSRKSAKPATLELDFFHPNSMTDNITNAPDKTNNEPSRFSREEVFKSTLEYFKGDELAANVWINKYALKDSDGKLYEQTPDDMHKRLAKEIHRIEKKYPEPMSEDEIYSLLEGFKFIVPQGGPMSGIGNDLQISSLSNCFVIGIDGESDSYGAIMKLDEEQVQLMKRRGGVGHDLSHIRPKGSPVKNSALTSTGVVPFMQRYSNTTREVAQDGRRGALMLTISIKHPDAEDFIDAKMDRTKVTGANVSIKIDDEFMQAVANDSEYLQQFPIDSDSPRFTKKVKARELWNKIIRNAWNSAEPGVLFWDTISRESVPDSYSDLGFKTVSTNPCGEIPLCPYDSCRLVAINLYSYVKNPFTKEAYFDFETFKDHVEKGQRIMDDIVDLEVEKIDAILEKITLDPESSDVKKVETELWLKIREKCLQGRRTGLGVTAEGDMLAALSHIYGTEESNEFSERVHESLALAAYRSSVEMAEKRGSFEIYDESKEEGNPFLQRLFEADPDLRSGMKNHGRRNIACLTIAPTGTTSLMTQTSSGLEPVFMVTYKRRRKVNPNDKSARIDFIDKSGDAWEEFHVFHHKFEDWLKINDYNVDEVKKMTDEQLEKIIEKSPYNKATANEIDWLKKVEMQGSIQKWVDHSISVTVNIPRETTEDVVKDIYQTAWSKGCKGMTIYRDGSRDGVLISKDSDNDGGIADSKAPSRPNILEANVVRFNNNDEKWIAVVGLLGGRPYEIFTGKAEDSFLLPPKISKGWVIKSKNNEGKSRYDFQYKDKDGFKVTIEGLSRSFNPEYWNYAKLISGILRHGMPLLYAINLVDNLHLNDASLNTWKNGVIRALNKFVPDGTRPLNNTCGECGEDALVYEEGCLNCKSCGFSQCG